MQHIVILFLFLLSMQSVFAECPVIPERLTKAISQHIQSIRASEYCEATSVAIREDISVVIYTAEGECGSDSTESPGSCSINWVRYMLGEYKGKIIGPIIVGGKGGLMDEKVEISGSTVKVSGLEVGDQDPLCCPSIPASKSYRFTESGFQEVLP